MSNLKSANLKYFNSLQNKDVQLFIDICKSFYWYTPPIDRTNLFTPPIKIECVKDSTLPNILNNHLSFERCVENRVEEILNLQNNINKKIVLCYSGGIDSTTILCNFIKYKNLKEISERLIIAMSPESILENPTTYKFIISNFETIFSLDTKQYLNDNYIVVIGDPGTGNFCHDGYVYNKNLILNKTITNFEFENAQYTILDKNIIKILCEETAKNYGVKLENYGDYHWWWHFNFRYNPINSRWHLRLNNASKTFWENQFFTFYSKETFQSWSLNEGRYMLSKQIKEIQKNTMKGIIDDEYILNKKKYFSASKLFRGIYSHKIINEDYQPITQFVPEYYYDPNNNFKELL